LQEAAYATGQIDIAHALGNEARNQEIVLEKIRQRVANPVLVAGDDRGMRDWQTHGVPEQGGYRKPVGQTTNHRCLGKGAHKSDRRMHRFIAFRNEIYDRHDHQHAGSDDLHVLTGIAGFGSGACPAAIDYL